LPLIASNTALIVIQLVILTLQATKGALLNTGMEYMAMNLNDSEDYIGE